MYTNTNGVFRSASPFLLSHMKERIGQQRLSLFAPMNSLLEECPQVAFMLNELINGYGQGPVYKTFFCNSHLEAVHGAIKIARHSRKSRQRDDDGRVLVFDESGYFRKYVDPQGGSEGLLVKGLSVTADREGLGQTIADDGCGIVVLSLLKLPDAGFDIVCDHCQRNNKLVILDISRMPPPDGQKLREYRLSDRFDIVCWGEGLAEFQLPFGAFSTSESLFRVWDGVKSSLIHSSTFGGNGMVVSYVKRVLTNTYPVFGSRRAYRRVLDEMETERGKVAGIRKFINSSTPSIYKNMGIGAGLVFGEGSLLYTARGLRRKSGKLDCTGGSGCNVFGHNDADLVDRVLDAHDPQQDYFQQLEERLQRLTGLDRMIQGVSGASAVEIALSLALPVGRGGRSILIFKGNFGGKTLAALNVTSGDHGPFQPLYEHVVVFDAFQADAATKLAEVLSSGAIGLVWMEIIQGRSMVSIPDELLGLVHMYKESMGYLVGVDEILNGLYRAGDVVSFDGACLKPDLMTFAKALSGMIMPVSVVLFSQELYGRITSMNRPQLDFWDRLYRNQLGCHIACHVLDKIGVTDLPGNVLKQGEWLRRELAPAGKGPKYINAAGGHGLHLHLHLNMRQFPLFIFGYERSNAILTEVLYRRGKLLCLFGRLLPPLNTGDEEAVALVAGIKRSLATHPAYFLFIGIRQAVRAKLSGMRAKWRGKKNRPAQSRSIGVAVSKLRNTLPLPQPSGLTEL